MEIDAYCFSKIADNAGKTVDNTTAITTSNAVSILNDGLLYMEENEVPAENQIIFCSPKFMNFLRNDTTELSRFLMQADYDKDVKFRMTSYEGRKIVVVPPQRFKTDIDLTGRGIGWKTTSAAIDFEIVAKDAVMHVVKYNKVKILSGDVVLAGGNYDGYAIFARVYHDVFVPENKRYAIYVHTGASTAVTPVTIAFDSTTNKISTLAVNDPARKMAFYTIAYDASDYATRAALTVGSKFSTSGLTAAKVGDSVTAKTTGQSAHGGDIVFAIDNGIIVAKKEYE